MDAGLVPTPSLVDYGLHVDARQPQVLGRLAFESPVWVRSHRLKNCRMGAFSYFNAAGASSAYMTDLGRYAQVGESCIIAPPEHPTDWLSTHLVAFTRPHLTPGFYESQAFAAVAPDAAAGPGWAEAQAQRTHIGNDVWIGAGSFIRRGVRIGDGAIIGARSVVLHDIPPYAIAVGQPAQVKRLRLPEAQVERLLALRWWDYDMAPWRDHLDWSHVEACLDQLESALQQGALIRLRPSCFAVEPRPGGQWQLESLPCL